MILTQPWSHKVRPFKKKCKRRGQSVNAFTLRARLNVKSGSLRFYKGLYVSINHTAVMETINYLYFSFGSSRQRRCVQNHNYSQLSVRLALKTTLHLSSLETVVRQD